MDRMCEVAGCLDKAKYNLYRYNPDGTKDWVYVCGSHEKEIGHSNLRRAEGNIGVRFKDALPRS